MLKKSECVRETHAESAGNLHPDAPGKPEIANNYCLVFGLLVFEKK